MAVSAAGAAVCAEAVDPDVVALLAAGAVTEDVEVGVDASPAGAVDGGELVPAGVAELPAAGAKSFLKSLAALLASLAAGAPLAGCNGLGGG